MRREFWGVPPRSPVSREAVLTPGDTCRAPPTPSPSLSKGPGPARKGLPRHLRAHCGKRLQTEAGLNSSPQSHGALLIKAAAQLSVDEGWPWTVRVAGICLVSGPVSWNCLCRPGGQRRPRRPHREGHPSLGARLSLLNPGDNEDLAQFLWLWPVGGPHGASGAHRYWPPRGSAGEGGLEGRAWGEHWAQVTEVASGSPHPLCHLGVRWVGPPRVAIRATRRNLAKPLNYDKGAPGTRPQSHGHQKWHQMPVGSELLPQSTMSGQKGHYRPVAHSRSSANVSRNLISSATLPAPPPKPVPRAQSSQDSLL